MVQYGIITIQYEMKYNNYDMINIYHLLTMQHKTSQANLSQD